MQADEIFALILVLLLILALFIFAGALLAGMFAVYGALGCIALHFIHKIW